MAKHGAAAATAGDCPSLGSRRCIDVLHVNRCVHSEGMTRMDDSIGLRTHRLTHMVPVVPSESRGRGGAGVVRYAAELLTHCVQSRLRCTDRGVQSREGEQLIAICKI